jgi:type VI protein secretion system component Hcp
MVLVGRHSGGPTNHGDFKLSIKQFAVASAILAIATGAMAADTNDITLKTAFGTSPIQSYTWGATNTTSSGSGGGVGTGKVVLQDLQVTRTVDAQSPQLLGAVNTGQPLACVELTDGSLKLTLRDVSVGSYLVGGSSGNKTPTVEQVSLTFASFAFAVDGVTQGTAAACQ